MSFSQEELKLRFTQEEFDQMVKELLYTTPQRYDMLSLIVEKTIRAYVRKLCYSDSRLQRQASEHTDELMQRIHLRLLLKVTDGFFLHKSVQGPFNNNPVGFQKWLFTVARNLEEDYAKKVSKQNKIIVVPPNGDEQEKNKTSEIPMPVEEDTSVYVENLSEALAIVLSEGTAIYKVLTWLAFFVYALKYGDTRIEASENILDDFSEKTLNEMYEMILEASGTITWLYITPKEKNRILSALRKNFVANVTYGEITYSNFFMKTKGVKNGKKSVSDWINRINSLIKKKTGSETEPQSEKGGKKDEASDN